MPLTLDQKNFLVANREDLQNSFSRYTGDNTHMDVYSNNVKCFITFSNSGAKPFVKFGKNRYNYCCSFITTENFDTQCDTFII
jgi:hypothetical protein